MVSDLLLPGLATQILALPYNPNNVSEDAAPCRSERSQGAFEAGGDRGAGRCRRPVVHGKGDARHRRRLVPRPQKPAALSRPADEEWRHPRSEEHTSELQSLMRISYAVFCLKNKNTTRLHTLYTIK